MLVDCCRCACTALPSPSLRLIHGAEPSACHARCAATMPRTMPLHPHPPEASPRWQQTPGSPHVTFSAATISRGSAGAVSASVPIGRLLLMMSSRVCRRKRGRAGCGKFVQWRRLAPSLVQPHKPQQQCSRLQPLAAVHPTCMSSSRFSTLPMKSTTGRPPAVNRQRLCVQGTGRGGRQGSQPSRRTGSGTAGGAQQAALGWAGVARRGKDAPSSGKQGYCTQLGRSAAGAAGV